MIFDAVSEMKWSGDAQVTVSIINWQKGGLPPTTRTLWLDEADRPVEVAEISGALSPRTDLRAAVKIRANKDSHFQGQTPGIIEAFRISGAQARALIRAEPADTEVIHPLMGGDELLKQTEIDDFIIDIPFADSDTAWAKYPKLLKWLEPTALAERQARADAQREANRQVLERNPKAKVNVHHINFLNKWWMLGYRREGMLTAIAGLPRYIALTRVSSDKRGPVFCFIDGNYHVSDAAEAFRFSDDYSLGILQSAAHTDWFRERCSTRTPDIDVV